jgi:hypothetical protein
MNEGTRSGKHLCLLGISAERPTSGLYLYLYKDLFLSGSIHPAKEENSVFLHV